MLHSMHSIRDVMHVPSTPLLLCDGSYPTIATNRNTREALVKTKVEERRPGNLFKSMFSLAEDLILRELGTKQVQQQLRMTLSIHMLCLQDSRIGAMFQAIVMNHQCLLTCIIPGSYLQLGVVTTKQKQRNLTSSQGTTNTKLEVLRYFHALHYFKNKSKGDYFCTIVSYRAGMRNALASQTVLKARKARIDAKNYGGMTSAVLLNLFYVFGHGQVSVLGCREEEFSPDTQRYRFSLNHKPTTTEDSVL